ncbi:VOC family protein [Methanobrevibacter arboriphilus]|uniref:hypothetical protein n=1 Tax=Methanobrevibacter arboriphilus TaxID=39441 RepID=UPI001CDADEB6|nr:hypothetical protein [Methanobrevibacter arboriphilus]
MRLDFFSIGIEVEDINKEVNELKSKGIEFVMELEKSQLDQWLYLKIQMEPI